MYSYFVDIWFIIVVIDIYGVQKVSFILVLMFYNRSLQLLKPYLQNTLLLFIIFQIIY